MNKSLKNIVLDSLIFQKFQKLYLLAFLGIALSIIISQILIQNHINDQLNDSRVINIAGRQRMLSQKLTKEVLLLKNIDSPTERAGKITTLKSTYTLWTTSYNGLQNGNKKLELPKEKNAEILSMFKEIDTYFTPINNALK